MNISIYKAYGIKEANPLSLQRKAQYRVLRGMVFTIKVPRQGSFSGTDLELFDAYKAAYKILMK
ncbi:hypothetical protein [Myroides sp. DF42-4-2]|uniref:hypothetical protein n=1 Tax=Myroides sp. DF42-4-2 TaxID=2746726 RepID=UPI002574C285|nr:hypothetical protein [Myroides sp. DF42-4-2]MDM1409030.1 hypothetical protein [Myroides sp. DF42-4-2]